MQKMHSKLRSDTRNIILWIVAWFCRQLVSKLEFRVLVELGLIAEYPNKFVGKRWQTQRFVRYAYNRRTYDWSYVICVYGK